MRTARVLTVSRSIGGGSVQSPLDADPPPGGQKEWQMLVKILPCPKLRLRATINLLLARLQSAYSFNEGCRKFGERFSCFMITNQLSCDETSSSGGYILFFQQFMIYVVVTSSLRSHDLFSLTVHTQKMGTIGYSAYVQIRKHE